MNALPNRTTAGEFMAQYGRSFRFASMALGPELRGRIERVYAWCRYTDNIVDDAAVGPTTPPNEIDRELDAWLATSRRAFEGEATGVELVDLVMTDLRESGGSFDVVEALVRGVRSDLHFQPYQSFHELRAYTYDVAAVVGRWLCALQGIHHPWLLHRAEALGHAMQLTNILRDVGEDLDAGRLYLPLELVQVNHLSVLDLDRMRSGELPVLPRYRRVIERVIDRADMDYALAWEAIPHLPSEFGRCVAVAAKVYAGIHDEIRANAYDNFTRRAHTSIAKKVWLAAGALHASAWPRRRPLRPIGLNGGLAHYHGMVGEPR